MKTKPMTKFAILALSLVLVACAGGGSEEAGCPAIDGREINVVATTPMIAIFYLVLQVLKIYTYVVIANVVISWLIAFNVLNTSNRFVYSILELTYRLTDPILNRIRRFLPNLGAFDISPIILLLLIWFIEMCMKLYVAPIIFS